MCSFGLSLWSNEFKFIYDWIWFYLTKNGNNIETPRRSQRAVIVIAPGVLINWCGCWAGSTASWMLANTVVRQRNIYLKPDFRIGLTTKNYTKIEKKTKPKSKKLTHENTNILEVSPHHEIFSLWRQKRDAHAKVLHRFLIAIQMSMESTCVFICLRFDAVSYLLS